MYKEDRKFIKKYFQILCSNHSEKLELDRIINGDNRLVVPKNMIDDNNPKRWKLMESNVTEEDIFELERSYNIKLPSIYKAFISSYFHMFEELEGVFNDFYYNDDSKVYATIIPQPSHAPLLGIKEVFEECRELIELGYIPIGEFNGWGPLCFDVFNDYKLAWFDREEYYDCEEREQLEELGEIIFDNFEDFIECFFGGIKYKCKV